MNGHSWRDMLDRIAGGEDADTVVHGVSEDECSEYADELARTTWAALGQVPRMALARMGEPGRESRLVRARGFTRVYLVVGSAIAAPRFCVRAMAERGLLAAAGAGDDPERVYVLTERARFIVDQCRGLPLDWRWDGKTS